MVNYLKEDTANPLDDGPIHLWYGTIAETIEEFTSMAYVILPDLAPNHRFGPCYWQARDNATLPERDNRCTVMFDNRGMPWIMSWFPDLEPDPEIVPLPSRLGAEPVFPSGNDLNNAKENGWYRFQPSTGHIPVSDYGVVHVSNYATANSVRQISYRHNSQDMWSRFWNGVVWSGWMRFVTEAMKDQPNGYVGLNALGQATFAPTAGLFGIGTLSAGDTNLYSSGGALKTDGNFAALGTITAGGRFFSGAPGTGGMWVDGGTHHFIGSQDASFIALFNDGWNLALGNDGKTYFGNPKDTNLYRSAANTLRTDDSFYSAVDIAANVGAANQIAFGTDGKIYFGLAADTTLYRAAPYMLKTDYDFVVGRDLYVNSNSSHIYMGSTNDVSLYRKSATVLGTPNPFRGSADISANTDGAGGFTANTVAIGHTGSGYGPYILFGNLADTNLYRAGADFLKTDNYFMVGKDLYVGRSTAGGVITFGNLLDTNLYRAAANHLATGGNLTVLGALYASASSVLTGTTYFSSTVTIDGNTPYINNSGALTLATNASMSFAGYVVLGTDLYLRSAGAKINFGVADDVSLQRWAAGQLRASGDFLIANGSRLSLDNGSNTPQPQIEFGWSGRNYRHVINTVHNGGSDAGNSMNFKIWRTADGSGALASLTSFAIGATTNYSYNDFFVANQTDTYGKLRIGSADGWISWGAGGAAGFDTYLYRQSAGVITSPSVLSVHQVSIYDPHPSISQASLLVVTFLGIGPRIMEVGPPDSGGTGYRVLRCTN